jgi:hypothetical protein
MNIQTVAENLRRTIAGKEKYLADVKRHNYWENIGGQTKGERSLSLEIEQFLEINIAELKRILADVESCVAKDVEQSWRESPDRMGGQFTDEEVRRAGEWR